MNNPLKYWFFWIWNLKAVHFVKMKQFEAIFWPPVYQFLKKIDPRLLRSREYLESSMNASWVYDFCSASEHTLDFTFVPSYHRWSWQYHIFPAPVTLFNVPLCDLLVAFHWGINDFRFTLCKNISHSCKFLWFQLKYPQQPKSPNHQHQKLHQHQLQHQNQPPWK